MCSDACQKQIMRLEDKIEGIFISSGIFWLISKGFVGKITLSLNCVSFLELTSNFNLWCPILIKKQKNTFNHSFWRVCKYSIHKEFFEDLKSILWIREFCGFNRATKLNLLEWTKLVRTLEFTHTLSSNWFYAI